VIGVDGGTSTERMTGGIAAPFPRRWLAAVLLAGPAATSAGGIAQAQPAGPIRFRILREGNAIGTHRVTFAEEPGGVLAATTEVEIAVRLAGITVFRMNHRFREAWAGDRLREATSRRDRNGTVTEMVVRAEGDGLVVRVPGAAPQRLPAEAAPMTWWDPRRFTRPVLFDNDDGRPLRLQWTRSVAPDGVVRWRCTGDSDSEGTYAADGTWLGWRTTAAEDGSVVTYERV
jgi:hypothetical protein